MSGRCVDGRLHNNHNNNNNKDNNMHERTQAGPQQVELRLEKVVHEHAEAPFAAMAPRLLAVHVHHAHHQHHAHRVVEAHQHALQLFVVVVVVVLLLLKLAMK